MDRIKNWVLSDSDNAINLNNIAHIWIQNCPNGYFLMGEMIHNEEEVCLSPCFDNKNKCKLIMFNLLGIINETL